MKRCFLAVLGLAAGQVEAVLSVAPGSHAWSLVHDRVKRTFRYHVPAGYDTSRQWPLLFVLHGGGGTPDAVAKLTGFDRLADSAGFIVAYPAAVNRHWNDGRGVLRFKSQRENVDDVGFIARLIDRFAKEARADPGRVYVAGVSNGGMMCHRLGCELSGKVAAIASVAAAVPENLEAESKSNIRCRIAEGRHDGAKPVSVLMINGTADPLVPWQGGGVGLVAKRGYVLSAPQSVRFWVERDGCVAEPDTSLLPHVDVNDSTRVRKEAYGRGGQGSEVVLYTVEGGGHTWPGGAARPARFGQCCRDMNATEVIWEFFRRHSR